MDKCSYFIDGKALFGSFPTQEAVSELESNGVVCFVDLTFPTENNIIKYETQKKYINYPIPDRKVPTDWKSFAKFIIQLAKIIHSLEEGEKLYINCKGGHGRSGVVVACLFCYMQGCSPEDALKLTSKCHNNRKEMRDKWRKMGAPQTNSQKIFVHKFFEPLCFYRAFKQGHTAGFSNFSPHPVTIPNIGTFSTSEAAFQVFKEIGNKDFVHKLQKATTPAAAKKLGQNCSLRKDWAQVKDSVMLYILELKFKQNEDIKETLMSTGLRPIVEHTRSDCYWGDGGDGSGKNRLGYLLTRLRNQLYMTS